MNEACPYCGGAGEVYLYTDYVTHDMALDAGNPNWRDCRKTYTTPVLNATGRAP